MSDSPSLPSPPPPPPGAHRSVAGAATLDRRARRRKRIIRALVVFGIFVVVASLALAGFTYYLVHKYDSQVKRVPDVFATAPNEQRPAVPKAAEHAQNFLMVGTDTRATVPTTGTSGNPNAPSSIGSRSDAIMVVHLSAGAKSGYVVSIPRDSWVPIPGHGTNKINAAIAWGGPRLLRETVEQLTGVRIDHYLEIDFAGFKAMTDAVGGVDIDVRSASYDSMIGKHWTAGKQHMDGTTALQYVRQRYGLPRGDFDRIEHQHDFLKALMQAASGIGLLQPRSLTRLVSVVSKSVSVDTSLSATGLFSLFRKLQHVADHAHFLTVPTTGTGDIDGLSVVLLDKAKDAVLWSDMRDDRMKDYPLPKGA